MEHVLLTYLKTPEPTSFEDTKTFGWARGMCLSYDEEHMNIWKTWLAIVEKGIWEEGDPVPDAKVRPEMNHDVYKELQRCFDYIYPRGYRLYEFIEWIGYALGIAWCSEPSKMPEDLQEYLYEHFPFEALIKHPSDYFSLFLAENGASNSLSYFPTPLHITVAMNMMLNPSWSNSVMEPCLGPGGMVLPTNSLNIVGMDLNPLMARAAAIQAFFYKPQLLFSPAPITGVHVHPVEKRVHKYFEFNTNTRIYCGNSLLGEFQAPQDIFSQHSELIDVYVHPIRLKKREIYNYVELLEQDWNSLTKEERFTLVRVMAREHKFDVVLTNPPFGQKLSKYERDEMAQIEKENEEFLSSMTHEIPHMKEQEELVKEKVYSQLTLF